MDLMIDCGAGDRYSNMTYPPSSDHSTFKKRIACDVPDRNVAQVFAHIPPRRPRARLSRTAAASPPSWPPPRPVGGRRRGRQVRRAADNSNGRRRDRDAITGRTSCSAQDGPAAPAAAIAAEPQAIAVQCTAPCPPGTGTTRPAAAGSCPRPPASRLDAGDWGPLPLVVVYTCYVDYHRR